MQVSVESGEGLEKRLLVDLPADRVNQVVEQKLQGLARNVRMDGFRPGKVPMNVVRKRFGSEARHEAYGQLIQETFYEAASQQDLNPAGEPSIEIREEAADGGFGYTATFEVMPEITVSGLSDMKVTKTVAEVSDADVDKMIETLRKQRTTYTEVEREAKDGDTIHLDFKGFLDGEAFEGGSAENVPLTLGSGAMIPGFEDALTGAKAGEERSFNVTFPEDYRAEHLAGKETTFEAKVLKVAEPSLPEIDEGFVKAFGVEAGTEEALRAEIRGNMERELKQRLNAANKEAVLNALLEVNPVDVPKAMITDEAARVKQQTMQQMAASGQQTKMDLPLSIFEEQAKRRVALGLLLGVIMKDQNLEVDQDRVAATIDEFAASYEKPEELKEFYANNPQQRAQVENMVLEEQVVDWLMSQAQVEEEKKTFDGVVGSHI